MTANQPEEKQESGLERREPAKPSKWWVVATVSVVLWMLLSLPLVAISTRFITSFRYQHHTLAEDIWNADFLMIAVMIIVTPLPIVSGIAMITFLFVRSAQFRRIAAIAVRLSLLGMAAIVFTGIVMVIEGERMGGDTGPLQVAISILIGVILPVLIGLPSILGLISLWRLKRSIPE